MANSDAINAFGDFVSEVGGTDERVPPVSDVEVERLIVLLILLGCDVKKDESTFYKMTPAIKTAPV